MRFSYIDSQGKEIEVDSVESLALRIELGAIKPETRMYDAVADRWAPAEEHPVFRSLSRGEEVAEDEVVPIGQEGGELADADAEPGEDSVLEDGVAQDADGGETAPAKSDDSLGLDFAVSLSDEESDGADEFEAGIDSYGDAGMLELENGGEGETESEGGSEGEGEDETLDETPAAASGDASDLGSATFGGYSEEVWGDDVESGPSDGVEPANGDGVEEVDAEKFGGGLEDDLERGEAAWMEDGESLWDEERADDSEAPFADQGNREMLDEDPAGSPPLPEWAAQELGMEEEEALRPERPARAPRPAHWDERKKVQDRKSGTARIVKIAATVVLVGAGTAYFAFRSPGDGVLGLGQEAAVPSSLGPELRSIMESASRLAFDDVLTLYLEEAGALGIAERPPPEWLEGIYLSTASAYPQVAEYWEDVEAFVESLRDREASLYEARLDVRLSSGSDEAAPEVAATDLDVRDEVVIREEALAEYEATAGEREAVYESVLGVAAASLELHYFLLSREDDISYEPYLDPGVSRDPVLEAVPNDSSLRVEMNEGLDRVIDSILESGVPRPITTETLFDHLRAELRRVGVTSAGTR